MKSAGHALRIEVMRDKHNIVVENLDRLCGLLATDT
jgi:hypothetical protein